MNGRRPCGQSQWPEYVAGTLQQKLASSGFASWYVVFEIQSSSFVKSGRDGAQYVTSLLAWLTEDHPGRTVTPAVNRFRQKL